MKFAIAFIVVFTSIISIADAFEKPMDQVSLVPQWVPQAQFAGYMVALDKGFYREAGIDLTLKEGGPSKPPFGQIATGKATFCTDWLTNGIRQRAIGQPIVELAQIIQKSALILAAKKASGITKPLDLDGKKVGLWEGHFYLQPMLFFKKFGVNVEVIPNYTSVGLFLKGALDAMSVMYYNEYHTLIQNGLDADELTTFVFSDYDLNFPEDAIFTLESTYKKDPDLCKRFVDASIRGWIYAFDHQEEALDIVMKYVNQANTPTNRPHQKWMLTKMKELVDVTVDGRKIGRLYREDYMRVAKIMLEQKMISDIPSFEEFYRGER
ncbi:MAG: ABC transporter substrate-binding protein [Desulfomonilaceae bacterium]